MLCLRVCVFGRLRGRSVCVFFSFGNDNGCGLQLVKLLACFVNSRWLVVIWQGKRR